LLCAYVKLGSRIAKQLLIEEKIKFVWLNTKRNIHLKFETSLLYVFVQSMFERQGKVISSSVGTARVKSLGTCLFCWCG